MSSAEARRPRRIIQVQVPPQQQPPPPPRVVERFQRALLAERRLPGPRPTVGAAQPLPATAPAAIAGRAEGAAQAPSAASSSTPRPAVTVQAPGFALPWLSPESRGPDDGAGRSIEVELSDADEWAQQLVHAIVTLCERTDPAIEAWSVTLPMEPRMFPSTELHLSLSRHRISLRFQTQSPEAVRILSLHRASLPAWLRQSLSRDRDIDIEIT